MGSEYGVVFTKLTGTLRREELWDHRKQIQAHPDFRTNLQQWIDMRELTVVALSAKDIARFAGSETVFSQGSRRAILVASDMQYGLGRMFETYAPGNFQLFREAQEACSFLGIHHGAAAGSVRDAGCSRGTSDGSKKGGE